MKKFISLILLFISIISFSQNIEYIKASNLSDNKKYVEANVLFEKLLRNEFGLIDNETRFFILSTVADNYYRLKDFQNSYDYYNITIDFVNKNHIHKELLKDIISLSEFIKTLVSSKKSNSTEVTDAAKGESKKTSDSNPVNGNIAFNNTNTQADKKETNTDKTVTLTVSGTGKTPEEAKSNALRSAIEQAFGAFISSKTEILNDNLIKDEIVSVANGNIQKFEIISEIQIPNGDYAASLKATVSVTKLTTFVESKGVIVEFKGSLSAFNVNQQILNEKNEIDAIENVCQIIKNIADNAFDYDITVSEPKSLDNTNTKWKISLNVSVYKNKIFDDLTKLLFENLKGLSLTKAEADDYIKLDKVIYPVSIALSENDYSYIFLRTEKSIIELIKTLYYFNHSLQNFKISNGIEEWLIKDNPNKVIEIDDNNFRFFLKQENNGGDFGAYCKASIFYAGTCDMRGGIILDYKHFQDNIDLKKFETALSSNKFFGGKRYYIRDKKYYFNDQFTFVNKLNLIEGKIYDWSGGLGGTYFYGPKSGLVISFVPSKYSVGVMGLDKKNQENKEIVKFYYEDVRTIDEINKIKEYKVSPIGN